jgi:hypothetical protein
MPEKRRESPAKAEQGDGLRESGMSMHQACTSNYGGHNSVDGVPAKGESKLKSPTTLTTGWWSGSNVNSAIEDECLTEN